MRDGFPGDLQLLRARIEGEVVGRLDAEYEVVHREMVWNRLAPAARPEVILRVAGRADVLEGVRFARERGVRVAVRGGGHHWSGTCLREGTMLIDLARLDGIEIDAEKRTAWVGPGVENRALASRLGAEGLAFPYGHCPTVKLSGYLLSGGLGWNLGMWGPACANLRAIELVTADGRAVTADAANEADLFWAARGAGPGFFAIATRFQLALHPLPRAIHSSTFVYPLSRLESVAAWAESLGLAPSVELALFLAAAPPELASACEADNGMACIAVATAFADSESDAAEALAPLESGPLPEGTLLRVPPQPTPFAALFDGVGQMFPAEHRWLADTFAVSASPREALPPLGRLFAAAPSRRSLAVAAINPEARSGALSLPAGLFVLPYAAWQDDADDERNRVWFRRVVDHLEPLAARHYVGESDLTATGRIERCYAAADWNRLQELRRVYDPDGLFPRP